MIKLVRARIWDAEIIWRMQVKAFAELLERYQDIDTSPANEPLEKTMSRLQQPSTFFCFIQLNDHTAGAVRVVDEKNGRNKRISPIFVMPECRNRGIAQQALAEVEHINGRMSLVYYQK